MAKLSEILEKRGYVYQHSAETLADITDGAKRTLYLGIDPTADSLHVGHVQNLIILRHFLTDGHTVIALVGGGTGMIGDPSGRSEERNLLDEAELRTNTAAIRVQMESILGSGDFEMVDNADWLGKLNLLEFLRDIGKHFTVNSMIKRDMVRERLKKESPISYTEFAYAILQAYDFLHLHEHKGVDLQIGASDQWGNIASGIELIRRKTGDVVYGFTAPLLVNKKTGKKFGKTEEGAVWLDSRKTSVFSFYQFWLTVDDESVEDMLLRVTLLPTEDVVGVMKVHAEDPTARHAQRILARAVTELVHGKTAAESAVRVSEVLFGAQDASALSSKERDLLVSESPNCKTRVGEDLIEVLARSGLASSRREAKEFIDKSAITLNGARVTDVNREIKPEDFQDAPIAILKRGKRNVCVLTQ